MNKIANTLDLYNKLIEVAKCIKYPKEFEYLQVNTAIVSYLDAINASNLNKGLQEYGEKPYYFNRLLSDTGSIGYDLPLMVVEPMEAEFVKSCIGVKDGVIKLTKKSVYNITIRFLCNNKEGGKKGDGRNVIEAVQDMETLADIFYMQFISSFIENGLTVGGFISNNDSRYTITPYHGGHGNGDIYDYSGVCLRFTASFFTCKEMPKCVDGGELAYQTPKCC